MHAYLACVGVGIGIRESGVGLRLVGVRVGFGVGVNVYGGDVAVGVRGWGRGLFF